MYISLSMKLSSILHLDLVKPLDILGKPNTHYERGIFLLHLVWVFFSITTVLVFFDLTENKKECLCSCLHCNKYIDITSIFFSSFVEPRSKIFGFLSKYDFFFEIKLNSIQQFLLSKFLNISYSARVKCM